MSQIVFERGLFQRFRATREVSIGGLRPPHGYKVSQGEILEFDGFQVRISSGETVESPSTRAAIGGGWFVLAGEHEAPMIVKTTIQTPVKPRIQVVQYEDQVVAQRGTQGFQQTSRAPQAAAQESSESRADRFLAQMRERTPPADQPRQVPPPVPAGTPKMAQPRQPKFAVVRQEELENEGIPIRSLRPQQKVDRTPVVSLGEGVIEDQRTVGRIQSSVRTEGPISLEDTAKVRKSSTDSIILGDKATVGSEDATPPSLRRRLTASVQESDQGGEVVGRLRTPTKFAETSVGGATGIQSQVKDVETQARIVPAPGSTQILSASDPRAALKVRGELRDNLVLGTIQHFIPGFAWNKNRRVDERIREALSHAGNPTFLKGVYVFESEEIQARILEAVPNLLS